MHRRHLAPIFALGIAVDLVVGAAQATEGGASLFIPGGHGPGAGIVPPPGFYFANDFFSYSGEINAFHVDLSISKNLTKEFSVGLLAGYYDQVSDDGGAGNRIGPFKGRVTAVGATAGYDFTVGGTPVSTRVKVLREVDVENRAQGTIGLFSVGFPRGGHAPQTSSRPVTAKD